MSNAPKGRGVLPVNAAATRKSHKVAPRTPAPKLRLIVRRLPPGLTETEFWDALGAEWHVGNGKIDWAAFKTGKIFKDLAKPSRPGRAYLKVKEQSLLDSLSIKIKQTSFQDARNTSKDSCLVGPPSLEFAPYPKTPSGRTRNDGRQGTIDQDPEFIDFLQSLTEPITRPAANGTEGADTKDKKIVMTPLVQYIKEKKANKAKEKEAAATKASKKNQDGKDGKGTSGSKSEPRSKVVKSTSANAEKARIQKATEDAVKAANRSAATIQAKSASEKSESKTSAKESSTAQAGSKRERQRGDASVAARMVARDLGLAPKDRSGRGSKASLKATESPHSPVADQASSSNNTTSAPNSPKQTTNSAAKAADGGTQPPTGPRNSRQNTQQSKPPTQPAPKKSAKSVAPNSADAKSAFLKHANPSQGVTEDLLRETFETYGTITRCEIDKKKGLGYIDFTEAEALKKAMAASPVKVGSGQVVVLENRSPYKKSGQQQQQRDVKGANASLSVASPALSAASSPKHATANMVTLQAVVNTDNQGVGSSSNPTGNSSTGGDSKTTVAGTVGDTSDVTPTGPRGGRAGRGNYRGGRGGARGRGKGNSGRGAASSNTTTQSPAVATTSTPTMSNP